MKKCRQCKETKAYTDYTRKTSNADNYNCVCKKCKNEEDKQRRIQKKLDKQFEIIWEYYTKVYILFVRFYIYL